MGNFGKICGICIIPEGRFTRECKEKGYPFEVSNIARLDNLLEYARTHCLAVVYLSSLHGLVYSDDVIGRTLTPISKFTSDVYMKWSSIVSEEIVRCCISYGTSNVHFMCTARYNYLQVIENISSRGIKVTTPILGCSYKTIPEKLLL